MESFTLELYPNKGQVHIALFQNVTNSAQLKQRLEEQDVTLGCTLVNAAMVMNRFHVLLAINKAVRDEQLNKLKTHNIYSEIIFDFSPTTNIAKTLAQFGMQDNMRHVIGITLGGAPAEAEVTLKKAIHGEMVPFDQLNLVRDLRLIEEIYRTGDQSQQSDKIMPLVTGAMALKGL
ncbi:kinase binding protein CGI-121-domain-containing protein [Pilobolus umbonatus]|nr:kinase binding protein CGI-121-domain-containing protein [Pilobolus umbonatus]